MVFQNLSVKRTKKTQKSRFFIDFYSCSSISSSSFPSFPFYSSPFFFWSFCANFCHEKRGFSSQEDSVTSQKIRNWYWSKERFPKNRPFPAPSCNGCNGCNGFIPALVAPHFPSDFWDFRIFSWFPYLKKCENSGFQIPPPLIFPRKSPISCPLL